MNKLIVTSSIAIVLLVPAVGMITAGNAQEGSNFDELINNTDSVSRMQQDLDNEQAFMECLETQTASECWDWVLEDCTRLLTVEECEAIEKEE